MGKVGTVRLDRTLGFALSLLALTACGQDTAEGLGAGTDSGQDGVGDGDDGPGTQGPAGVDSTGGGVDEGDPGDTDAGAADSGGGDGIDEFSCDADCGPDGACAWDDAGNPACTCAAGYAAYGMRCLPCTKSDGALPVTMTRAELTMRVTVNGDLPPDSPYEHANVWLRDRASGDQILMGDTRAAEFRVSVLPGTYDVMYERIVGGGIVPRNDAGIVLDQLQIEKSMEVLVDIPVVRLAGRFTLDGQTPPTGPYEHAQIVLVNPTNGDEILLGDTRDGDYVALVLPGKYQVHYRRVVGGAEVPRNDDAYFSNVDVPAKPEFSFDVDVPVVDISGNFRINAAAPPTTAYETAFIRLHDPQTGDEIVLGETRDQSYSARVIPGIYEVVYDRSVGGAVVPVNEDAVIATVDVGLQPDFDVNIQTAGVFGSFTLDGAAVPNLTEDAVVLLVDPQTGDEIQLGHLSSGSFDRLVLAGNYDVVYHQLSAAGTLPANTGAHLGAVQLTAGADEQTTVNITTAAVSGTILMGGAVPPTSEYSDGRLYLRNEATDDSILLGSTRVGGFTGTVIPGEYSLVYVVETAGQGVPVNREAKILDSVSVNDGSVLNIDIPVFDLLSSLVVDGAKPPTNPSDRGQLLLQDVLTGDAIYLGGTDSGDLSRKLTGGTYVVVYEGLASTGLMPANAHAGVACIELTAP